jgi:small-conductance mechanosensitive channel
VAQAHPDVHQSPEPTVVFLGFGESSLDFQLMAWIDFLEGFRITTELNLAIWDALAEAGIEIPFPQRDLHLRSVAPEAGERLSPSRPSSGTAEPTRPGQAPVDTSGTRGLD